MTKGELQLFLYKWKTYLGSVGRYIRNKRIKNKPYYG